MAYNCVYFLRHYAVNSMFWVPLDLKVGVGALPTQHNTIFASKLV
jgi:hypothetical protein